MKINTLKNIARRLERAINAHVPNGIKHQEVLDILGRAMGYRSYQGCKSSLENPASLKEYTDVIFTFYTNRQTFTKIMELRNTEALDFIGNPYELHYHDNFQVLMFTGEDIAGYSKNWLRNDCLGKMLEYCRENGIRVIMTVNECRHEDYAHTQEMKAAVAKGIEDCNAGRTVSSEDFLASFPDVSEMIEKENARRDKLVQDSIQRRSKQQVSDV